MGFHNRSKLQGIVQNGAYIYTHVLVRTIGKTQGITSSTTKGRFLPRNLRNDIKIRMETSRASPIQAPMMLHLYRDASIESSPTESICL